MIMNDLRCIRFTALLLLVGMAVLIPSISPVLASGPFTVPQVAYVAATVPSTPFSALVDNICLVRSEPSGVWVSQRLLCYSVVGSGPPPPPPPPPYEPLAQDVLSASFNGTTGELTVTALPCAEFLPGFLAAKVDLIAQLDRGGGQALGSVILTTDVTFPFDCVGGSQTTGPLTLTPLPRSHDQDLDGCADWEELGTLANAGSLRDPFNFWDFFDTPDANNVRDKAINLQDQLAVSSRFAAIGDPNIDPLSPPPPAPAYHPAFDRGDVLGPNDWNRDAANGAIGLADILAIGPQFGHTCAGAP